MTFDLIDVRQESAVPERLLPALARLGGEALVAVANVEEGKRGLVFINGPAHEVFEMRRQTSETSGQEIPTRDKVTVRASIAAVYEIVDAVAARSGVKDVNDDLHRTLQIAVRQRLGKRTLEEVLAEKADIDQTVSAEVSREMEMFGVRMGAIALKDIILPGDIRDILNQVVTAEKQAQANLIRCCEDTTATRSLLNAAELMEESPVLVRMKELETLEKIAEKVKKSPWSAV